VASRHAFHGLSAASFFGMWVVMMVPMMLPSLVPMLWHHRRAAGNTRGTRLTWLTLVALGYFFVWWMIGVAVYPLGIVLTTIEKHLPVLAGLVPIAAGVTVLIAGGLQFTAWKAHRLACCREAAVQARAMVADTRHAWRYGMRLGLLCAPCCANLMAILLVIGAMDLRAMAAVTAAITAERLAFTNRCQARNSERVAKAIGTVVVGTGVFLIARAVGQ
jgi:predicted metal-binding membrane protein